jgi:hypothetical protein
MFRSFQDFGLVCFKPLRRAGKSGKRQGRRSNNGQIQQCLRNGHNSEGVA